MYRMLMFATWIWLAAGAVALAQHAGHQAPAPPASGPDPKIVAACVKSQQEAAAIAAHVNRRLEAARQTNSAAEMRAAMDDLQAAMTEIQSALGACDPLQAAAAPADPHGGHPTAAAAPPAPAPVLPADAIDPVCAMKVDPRTAPKADYQGRTYYFCSEADRQRFVKDPGKYIRPGE